MKIEDVVRFYKGKPEDWHRHENGTAKIDKDRVVKGNEIVSE